MKKLLASSGSLEGIAKTISQFYYAKTIVLKPNNTGGWDIYNGEHFIQGTVVKKQRGRYRFEERE